MSGTLRRRTPEEEPDHDLLMIVREGGRRSRNRGVEEELLINQEAGE